MSRGESRTDRPQEGVMTKISRKEKIARSRPVSPKPAQPKGELSDHQLNEVAGGNLAGNCCTGQHFPIIAV
jgi:hypothetical protein